MALILCKQRASVPYYYEKLNLRIWSSQELCYLIYNFPLMVSEDFIDEDLCDWIGRELREKSLSLRLRESMENGETENNMLLMILSSCGYYTRNEINAYMDRLMEISRLDHPSYLREVGRSLFKADRLDPAYDRFEEAVRILFFEDKKALELILQSELCLKTDRAREMKYLLTGDSELSDDDKKRLDIRKEELKLKILSEEEQNGTGAIFRKDPVKALREAGELLGRLKKEYRRML